MERGFEEIIDKILSIKGKDILLEPKIFISLLLDYTKDEYKREKTLLIKIIESDCIKVINRADNLTDCKQFLIKKLEDDYSLSPLKSGEILDLLFNMLRKDKIHTLKTNETNLQSNENVDVNKLLFENNQIPKLDLIHGFFVEKANSVSFSPDNKNIIYCNDYGFHIISIEKLDYINHTRVYNKSITKIKYSANHKYIVIKGKLVNIYHTEDIKYFLSIKENNRFYHTFSISPDSKHIITGSYNELKYDSSGKSLPYKKEGKIQLWDIENGILINAIKNDDFFGLAFSPNGKYFASYGCDSRIVRLYDTEHMKLINKFKLPFYNDVKFFSSDSKIIALTDNNKNLILRDIDSGEHIHTFKESSFTFNSIDINPNNKYFISGTSNGNIKFWDMESGKCIQDIKCHDSYIDCISFSSNGNYLVTSSFDSTIKLWRCV